MTYQNIPPSSLTSLAAVVALGDELANPYIGINQYAETTVNDAATTINTINDLISQPDYLTYATQEEQAYYTTLLSYLTDFIKNFPTMTE